MKGTLLGSVRLRAPALNIIYIQYHRQHIRSYRSLIVRADVRQSRGRQLDEDSVQVGSPVGEGSFGQVFQGNLDTRRIILKRVKDRVQGAQEMAEMEHLLNVYASSACKKSIAPFIGFIEVTEPRGRLTKGLWLVWGYEGDKTLAYYLRRRDCIEALAEDLGVDSDRVIPTVMQQIFECLIDIHSSGLVHRDVKPANIIFSDTQRRFKLIDLGAAADLRTGTNYRPSETILDPSYCPPEEYILPTDAPHLAKQAAPIALLMSPVLWAQHRPDCFDSYSAGIVMLQLALPFLRSTTALKNWRATFSRCGYDLDEWRIRSALSAKQTMLLDANDGLGWEVAGALLRPREVEVDEKGSVRFINTGSAPRLTPAAALRHPYFKQAMMSTSPASSVAGLGLGEFFRSRSKERGSSSSSSEDAAPLQAGQKNSSNNSSSSSSGNYNKKAAARGTAILEGTIDSPKKPSGLSSAWNWMKNKLYDVEARVKKQASDTEVQTVLVEQLRKDVAAGRASKNALDKEEQNLQGMQKALKSSMEELNDVYSSAKGLISSVLRPSSRSAGSRDGSQGSNGNQEPPRIPARVEGGGGGGGDDDDDDEKAPPSTQQELSSQLSVADVATNAIYSGLKFTGMAINTIAEISAAAERGISKAKEEAAAERAASAAFISALQSAAPAIASSSTWEDVVGVIPDNAEYDVLTDKQRKATFRMYVDALQRVERAAAQRALDEFKEMLKEKDYDVTMTYPRFASRMRKDKRFIALNDDAARKAAFEGFMAEKLLVEAAARAKEEKKEKEREKKKAALEAAGTVSDSRQEGLQTLEQLRSEQARLKEEYEKMEVKLRDMEKQLLSRNVMTLLDDGSLMEADIDGNVIFKFAKSPPYANANGSVILEKEEAKQ